jgi:hypothetical protein
MMEVVRSSQISINFYWTIWPQIRTKYSPKVRLSFCLIKQQAMTVYYGGIIIIIIIIIIIMVLKPFGLWPLFQFLDPIHSR